MTDESLERPPGVSEYLTRKLLDLVRSERLQPGDRLPSVQALASRFSVAAPTIRESLRRLQAVGLLEIRHGSGVYVKRPTHPVVLPNPHPGRLPRRTILDLLDARLLIEPQLASLAAQRASDAEVEEMRRTLAEAGVHLRGDDRLLHGLNMGFHREVAVLSGSTVLGQVIDSLVDVYVDEQLVVMELYDNRERDHQHHLAILEAIAGRDPDRSRQLMHGHLRSVRDTLDARLPGEEDPETT
jgi:GntR family transcriptional regulator, transcriptional repressor for pyruvate dehydrogenase complex